MPQRTSGRATKKIFHKIGEVCELTKTEPYVLRYWESEFPFLAPEKNRAGQRIYTDEDIQTVLAIKRLLYEEGYTTAGARRKLEQVRRDGGAVSGGDDALTAPESPAAQAAQPQPADAQEAAAAGDADPAMKTALRTLRDDLRALRSLLEGDVQD